jgi:hypothetical protein
MKFRWTNGKGEVMGRMKRFPRSGEGGGCRSGGGAPPSRDHAKTVTVSTVGFNWFKIISPKSRYLRGRVPRLDDRKHLPRE